jgi:hypothetical protein
MQIAQGAKFAAYFLGSCRVADDIPSDGVEVFDGIWAANRCADIDTGGYWARALGRLTMDEFDKGGLALYIASPAASLETIDDVNERFKRSLEKVFQSLQIDRVPRYSKGFCVTGANVEGHIWVGQLVRLRDVSPTPGLKSSTVTRAYVEDAAALAPRLQRIANGGTDNWNRLRRGIRALLIGSQIENVEGDRLHQFVRALESLVLPREGSSAREFAHRCRVFARTAEPQALRQLYDMRTSVEHLHSAARDVSGQLRERIDLVNRRTRQADALARFAIGRVIKSDALLNHYRDDRAIAAFWKLSDADHRTLFGDSLDIDAIK